VGGATTEDEALQILRETNPDILMTSEDLEMGYGIRLIEKAKEHSSDLKALIFLQRETPEVVQEAMAYWPMRDPPPGFLISTNRGDQLQ
jgi:DNA-binding NarL/FixJ family response regulator